MNQILGGWSGYRWFTMLIVAIWLANPINVHAEEEIVSGSRGTVERPIPTEKEASSPFDHSDFFVPPHMLPIVKESVEDASRLSDNAIRENESTISITPSGEVMESPAQDHEIKLFRDLFSADVEIEIEPSEEPGSLGPEIESVIGEDTRRRVTRTSRYPFRTIGLIGNHCTGTLIGSRHVLTAGHCVYNIKNDKWYSKLSFSAGQDGQNRQYNVEWKRAITVKGWARSHKRNYDYAMIVLVKDIGNTVGWMGYGYRVPMPNYSVNIIGYPGDKPYATMWQTYCRLEKITHFQMYYPCDTYGGMSGSAVYAYWRKGDIRITYGIHAYAVDNTGYNGATRITKQVFKKLKSWQEKY